MATKIKNLYLYLALAFFLSMDIPQLIKIVISIVLGIALIFLAAHIQRRQQDSS